MRASGGRSPCGSKAATPRRSACRTCESRLRAHPRDRRNPGAASSAREVDQPSEDETRRLVLASLTAGSLALVSGSAPAHAAPPGFKKDLSKRRRRSEVSDDAFVDVPGVPGLKIYDLTVGTGQEVKEGDRVVVHFDVKLRNLTVATSRQGMGVTGGTPYGFEVGLKPGQAGATFLKGMDLGVVGMRSGGFRRMVVPPDLAYGNRQVQEIPPNATLTIDIELLSIKLSPLLGLNS